MKSIRIIAVAGLSVLLFALVLAAVPAQGAPEQQTNLLRNGDFESGFYDFQGDGGRRVPNEWDAWWDSAKSAPRYNPSDVPQRIQSGQHSASYWDTFTLYDAGLRQIVPNVKQGAIYRFTAYGQSWSWAEPDGYKPPSDGSKPPANTDVYMRIGVDPTGGTDPFSPNVVWSGNQSPRDAYALFQVDVTAKSTQLVVFLRGGPAYAVDQTDTYLVNAGLDAHGTAPHAQAATTPTPKPSGGGSGVPAGTIPKSTPAPDGSIVHIVRPGETLTGIAQTYGVTIDEIKRLNNLTSDVIFVGQKLVIKLPDGQSDEPTPEPTEEIAEGPEEENTPDVIEPPAEQTNGTICVLGFDDLNGNGLREPGEQPLAGITFLLSDGVNTLGTYTTDGATPSYCFTEVVPGQYIVSWTGDGAMSPTNETPWVTTVSSGATVSHEFGANSGDSSGGADEKGARPGGGIPTWLIAVVAGLGAILLLGGLGAAGYFFLIRQNSDIE